jgi:hypothetical protein
VFALCVSPGSFTIPPSEAATVKVYVTVGVGSTASGIGLSLEQELINRNKNDIRIVLLRILFIV